MFNYELKCAIMHKFVAVLYNFLEMKWSQLETGKKFIQEFICQLPACSIISSYLSESFSSSQSRKFIFGSLQNLRLSYAGLRPFCTTIRRSVANQRTQFVWGVSVMMSLLSSFVLYARLVCVALRCSRSLSHFLSI